MNVLELVALMTLDKSAYDSGLKDASDSASSVGDKLKSGLGTAAKVGVAALAAGTGAAVAFSKSAVSAGAEFDKSMSQVAATMGNVDDTLGQDADAMDRLRKKASELGVSFDDTTSATELSTATLRKFALEMGSTTAFSASQAADALNYMALAGYDAETSIKMLPNVLNLAAAGNIDLARASDMVTDAQTALGLELDETTIMVDQMAKTASTTNTSVEQLGDAILTIGGTAQFMSGGTEELSAVLGALADNGIKGSEAGTHLRNMLLKLSSPTDDGAAALKELGVAVFDDTGKMRSFADIFGDLQSNMNNVTPVIKGAYDELAKMSKADLAKALEEGSIATSQLGVELFTSTGQLREWGEVAKDISAGFVDGAMTDQMKIQMLSDIFNARDVAAAQALMNTTTERWEEIGVAIEGATGSAGEMANTQLDNLTGDMTMFKSALEGAKITLSDQLTPTLRGFVQLGTSGLSKITTAFNTGGLDAAMDAVGEFLSDGINLIVENLPGFVEAGAQIITGLMEGVLENLPQIIDSALSIIETLVNTIVENLPLLLDMGIQLITKLALGLAEAAPTLIPVIIDALLAMVTTLMENAPMMINAAITLIVSLAQGLINSIPKLIARLPEIIEALVAYLASPNNVKILFAATEIMIQLAVGLVKAIPELVKSIPKIIAAIVSGLLKGLVDIVSVGGQFVAGLWEGINDKVQWVIDKIKGFGDKILKGIKSFFGIASPSKVMAQIGEYMGEGLGLGWEDAMDDVRETMMDDLDLEGNVAVKTDVDDGGIESANAAGSNNSFADSYGNLIIPVYIGGEQIDEIIVDSRRRVNMRSGGLASV